MRDAVTFKDNVSPKRSGNFEVFCQTCIPKLVLHTKTEVLLNLSTTVLSNVLPNFSQNYKHP